MSQPSHYASYDNNEQVHAQISLSGLNRLLKRPRSKHNGEDVIWTSDPTVELPIKVNNDASHLASLRPDTVVEVFQRVVRDKESHPALRVEREGVWKEWSYKDYYNEAQQFAKALIAIEFQKHQVINILGFKNIICLHNSEPIEPPAPVTRTVLFVIFFPNNISLGSTDLRPNKSLILT